MDSDRPDSRTRSQELVAKTRMAHHALFEPEGFDLRTAIVLSENGLLRQEPDTFEAEAEIVSAVRDLGAPNRMPIPTGPLVAVRSLTGGENPVVTASDLLYSETAEARQAALAHLERLELTDRSRSVLDKFKGDILGGSSWRAAAVEVIDALEDDFLYNLAGLHQCVAIGHHEGAQAYAPLVMRPSLSSVNALDFGIQAPSQDRAAVAGWIEETVREAGSVADLCGAYYSKAGHLPLTGELSLGAAVRAWVERKGEGAAPWPSVWGWANAVGGPLPRYHACQVFIVNPQYVPEGMGATLWGEIIEVIAFPERGGESLKWVVQWQIRCELLRHFASHFECLAPGEDGERIASAAMWVTERVARVSALPRVDVPHLLDKTIIPIADQTRGVWQIARPPASPCSLRYAAMFSPSLWSLSLLGEAGGRIRDLAAKGDGRADERVKETLLISLMQGFPLWPPPEVTTYSFDRPLLDAAEAWARPAELQEENLIGAILAMVECQRTLSDPQRLETEIRQIADRDEANQYILAQAVRVRAYTSALPIGLMRECLWDAGWRAVVTSALSPASLSALWDGLVELQVRQGGEWITQLPHLWAALCNGADESGERYGELINLVFLASINAGSVSALRQVLTRPTTQVVERAARWRDRVEGAIEVPTPWTQAKLRAFLSALSLPNVLSAENE